MNEKEELQRNRFLMLVVAIFTLEAILFSVGNFKLNKLARLEQNSEEKTQTILHNLALGAKAVSVYNITQSKKIYGKNDNVSMPLASLAKTMTVMVALKNHKFGDIVNIPMSAISQAGDYGMLRGEKWYMSDLAKATLIASANDGAYALSVNDPQFVDEMNARAKRLGMENTLFSSPTGLDILSAGMPAQAGGIISAEDANTMAIFALRTLPQIFYVTTLPKLNIVSLSGFNHNFKNTDIGIDKIPNLLFSKTGFTDLAGGNLSIIFRNKKGEEIAVTILGSTYEGRFTDIEKIVNVLYNS